MAIGCAPHTLCAAALPAMATALLRELVSELTIVGRPGAVGLGHRDGLGEGGGLGQTDVLANLGNTLQKRIPERLLRWTAAGVLPSGSRPDDLFGVLAWFAGP